jgi:hypothetical protein
MNGFSAGSCIRFGWEAFKKRPWFLIFVTLVISILEGGYRYQYQTNNPPTLTPGLVVLIVVTGIVVGVIATLARMGRVKMSLKAHDDVSAVHWKDLWAPHPFWRYIGASLLTGLIVLVGFILLIVPGIIFALRYMFVPYIVMDKGLMPMDALRESARITYGYKWQLFGFFLLLVLLNILGLICLIVGLLVTVPITWLAVTRAYKTLEQKAGSAPAL